MAEPIARPYVRCVGVLEGRIAYFKGIEIPSKDNPKEPSRMENLITRERYELLKKDKGAETVGNMTYLRDDRPTIELKEPIDQN